jgi:hypothetical protein
MNWSKEQIEIRNQQIFGVHDPASQPPERPAENASEAVIEGECCQLLREDNWRILKTNPVSSRARAKGFGELGMPDVLALRYRKESVLCEVLWIEWKAPGGRVRKHQTEWHIRERARGAVTVIAGMDFPASIEGFRAWYLASGLVRSRIW